jgi:hypothetical protein
VSVWVVWAYDVGPEVIAIFSTSDEAVKAYGGSSYAHITEVPLPCTDFEKFIRAAS